MYTQTLTLTLTASLILSTACSSTRPTSEEEKAERDARREHVEEIFDRSTHGNRQSNRAPVTEAILEYVGPPSRWAGPQSFVVQITSRPEIDLSIAVDTPWDAKGILSKMIADRPGASRSPEKLASAHSIEITHARLQVLASQLDEETTSSGCAYPLRVRLLRSDGSVQQKSGCRSAQGWPLAVSQTMSEMIEVATLNPMTVEASRATASLGQSVAETALESDPLGELEQDLGSDPLTDGDLMD